MPDDFGFTTFEPFVDDVFTFDCEGEPVDLTLARAEPRGTSAAGVPAGVLTFVGPREPLLPQSTYPVRHVEAGEFLLFIVPIGQGESTTTYEAVFG